MYLLGDIPRKSALLHPDRKAIVFEDVRLTYRELNNRVNRLANSLSGMGYRGGDRLTILGENSHKFLEVYFAAAKLGLSVTPLNYRLSDGEIEHIVNDSEAVCFFAGDGYEERALALQGRLGAVRDWIALDNPAEGWVFYEDLIGSASSLEPEADVDENEMAVLMYTGGTTGLPKGVMMSHKNIMTAVISAALGFEFTKDDITCFILPLFHVSFWPALCVLMVGGKAIINRKPELNEILRLIQDERCTHINAVPTIYIWMLQRADVDAYDLSSLRLISYAGSPFPPEMLRQCIRAFGNKFTQGYGMTEALGVTSLGVEDHVLNGDNARLLSSAGKANLCSEIRIVDSEGRSVKTGGLGEVAVKGRHVMMGYWKNPELTAETIRDGWYHSGDMGYLDDEGYLFLVDRKADMIVTGGENVYPKETEDVLYEHPAVAMAAVVSAPDDKWGEIVQAAVTLKTGSAVAEDELIQHCKERLAGYKCPKKVEFWENLPTTPIGKILRKEIKKKFWKDHDRTIG